MRWFDEIAGIKHSSRLMQPDKFLCAGLACSLALGAAAQDTNKPPQTPPAQPSQTVERKIRVVTLEECIALALQHNLDIQIQRLNPVISQYTLDIAYAGYEPVFTFSAVKSFNSSPGGINSITGLPFNSIERNMENYNAGLQGTLPTGLSYNFTGPLTKESQSQGTNTVPTTWSASPGVNLTQHLLQNFWIDNTRLQIQLDKTTLKISEQTLRGQIMTSVTSVESAYYTLLYDRENVTNNATALKLALQLAAENKKKVEVGTLAQLDEKQAESQAASSQAALLAAEQTLTTQQNLLKSLITDNYNDWVDTTIVPVEQLVAVPQTLDLQESWRHAFRESPTLLEQRLRVEQQNVTLRYDFNQLFPALDLVGSYGRNAFNPSLDQTFDNVRAGKNPFYSYGVNLSFPLGNTAARDSYKSTKVSLKQVLLQLKQLEQNVQIAVADDVGLVRSTLQQVDATREARIYAEDALAAEQKKLENGKSTSFQVLQLISNLTAARSSEIQALANYNIAVTQLSLDEGSTLEKNHIDLKVK